MRRPGRSASPPTFLDSTTADRPRPSTPSVGRSSLAPPSLAATPHRMRPKSGLTSWSKTKPDAQTPRRRSVSVFGRVRSRLDPSALVSGPLASSRFRTNRQFLRPMGEARPIPPHCFQVLLWPRRSALAPSPTMPRPTTRYSSTHPLLGRAEPRVALERCPWSNSRPWRRHATGATTKCRKLRERTREGVRRGSHARQKSKQEAASRARETYYLFPVSIRRSPRSPPGSQVPAPDFDPDPFRQFPRLNP